MIAKQLIAANELAWRAWTAPAATAEVSRWLLARGLDPVGIRAAGFQVGAAPASWDSLTDLLARHRVPNSVALAAGLVRASSTGRHYDGFRDRMVLPVREVTDGALAGFTARRLGEDPRAPKYLNSPASPAFRKGRLLFGAWEARSVMAASRESVEGLVVCEGPFDVLAVASTGRWAAVAPCGTALTLDQAGWIVALARAFDVSVQLAFDADPPGQAASDRAWDLLVDAGVPALRLADLPEGSDPADLSPSQLDTALTLHR